jgi:GT2 family glycosyltransferase
MPRLVSVVVPVHERPDLAARCFAALDSWSVPLEVVVVDDGSGDPGVGRLRESRAGYRWLRNEAPTGFSAAVNRGIGATSGDPILLLNSDAEVRPGGDRALLEAFERGPGGEISGEGPGPGIPVARESRGALGAVAARLRYPDGRPQWSGGPEPSRAGLFALASGLGRRRGERAAARGGLPSGFAGGEVEWAPAAALALTRAAWNATGPFDERFAHYAQDLDYGHRLRAAGFRLRVEPAFEVLHHLGGSAGGDAALGQRVDLLWRDLAAWVEKARGPAAARAARRTLSWGGRLQTLRLLAAGDRAGAARIRAAIAAVAWS